MPPAPTDRSIARVGLNYISEFHTSLLTPLADEISWLEIRSENFFERGGLGVRQLDILFEKFPFVSHTVSLALGSPDPLDWDFLKKLKAFNKKYKIPFTTDHLATSQYQNASYQMLLPIPWTKNVALFVAEKIRQVQDFLEIPFGIENIPYTFFPTKPEMTETDFMNLILEKSDCHLLLDINDVILNAHNYDFDAWEFLKKINKSNLIEIHVAGFSFENNICVGEHAFPIQEETFSLLEKFHALHPNVPILFEWENDPPSFEIIQKQIHRLNQIYTKSHEKC